MKKILKHLKQQVILLFYAISYFTRLPIPASITFDNEQFHKANAYLPIIGIAIALMMMTIFTICQYFLSIPVSLIMMLIASLLLTGALHEDGFADCCDGLGGGYSATQRLKIMKDSQIGSYAGIGLVMLFLLKLTLLIELTEISHASLFISLLIAHSLSRYGALCIMQTLPYVRLDADSKVKTLATKLPRGYFIFASLCALPSLLLVVPSHMLIILCSTLLCGLMLAKFFSKNLQGYTGDCLGFAQQCIELITLLLLTVVLAL